MANKLLKHLLGYGAAGNAGALVANDTTPVPNLTTVGSTAVVGVCTDWSGNVYLSDAEEHIIIKVTEPGVVTLFAGEAGTPGMTNGISTVARFDQPMGVDCDRSGNIYVADFNNNQIRKIDPNGNVSLLAGSSTGVAGSTDGANGDAKFNAPVDVKVDASGNVYVSDTGNNKIRLIRGANTVTIAGTGVAGDVIGKGNVAQFNAPYGISCDKSGKIFVADSGNSKIKMIQTDFTVYNVPCTDSLAGGAFTFGSLKYLEIDNSGFIHVVDYNTITELSRLLKFNQEGIGGVIVEPLVTKIGIAISPNRSIYVTQSGVDFNSSSSSASSLSSSSVSSLSSLSSSSESSVSSSSESSVSSSSESSVSSSSESSVSSSSESSISSSSISSISLSSLSSSSVSSISSSSISSISSIPSM